VDGLAARTVLIVEDEWLVRMELVAAFEDACCTVLESTSVEDALGSLYARQQSGAPVDLLVTDIRLNGTLTGWDLAEAVRGLDTAIAVIYVSANPPAAGRGVPGSVFIDKPALMAQVIAAAHRLLDHA